MRKLHLRILRWTAIVYPILALAVLLWTVHLSADLPPRHINWHWDISWIGFDIVLSIALAVIGLLAYKKSRWIVIPTTMLGTLLIVDVWFDILSQRGGDELHEAILLALFIELPLAIASFVIAGRALTKNKD